MRPHYNLQAVFDTVGFDLADPSRRRLQVRFAKCKVYDDGLIERQYNGPCQLVHIVDILPQDDIDAVMAVESMQLINMGYDPPTPQMIDRIRAHCAVEWAAKPATLMIDAVPMEPLRFDVFSEPTKVTA